MTQALYIWLKEWVTDQLCNKIEDKKQTSLFLWCDFFYIINKIVFWKNIFSLSHSLSEKSSKYIILYRAPKCLQPWHNKMNKQWSTSKCIMWYRWLIQRWCKRFCLWHWRWLVTFAFMHTSLYFRFKVYQYQWGHTFFLDDPIRQYCDSHIRIGASVQLIGWWQWTAKENWAKHTRLGSLMYHDFSLSLFCCCYSLPLIQSS